jgi:hypothetical protein
MSDSSAKDKPSRSISKSLEEQYYDRPAALIDRSDYESDNDYDLAIQAALAVGKRLRLLSSSKKNDKLDS